MPSSRRSLLLSRAQQPGTDYWPYPLPPSPWKHTQHLGDNSLLTPKKETANIQTPTPKINSKAPKEYKCYSCTEVTLQYYSLSSPNSQKKKNTSKMKKHRNHSQLKEEENSPKSDNNETDLCSLMNTEFKTEVLKILK